MEKKKYSVLLSVGHFCADINAGCLAALLPFLIAAYHYDYGTAALLVMASNLVGSAVQLVFGGLADRRNMPAMMLIGIVMSGAGMALVGVTDSFVMMCAAAMVSGTGIAMFHPQAMKLLNQITVRGEEGNDVSIFSFGGNLGVSLGPVAVTACVKALGLKGTLLLLIPPAVSILLFCGKGRALMRPVPDEDRMSGSEGPPDSEGLRDGEGGGETGQDDRKTLTGAERKQTVIEEKLTGAERKQTTIEEKQMGAEGKRTTIEEKPARADKAAGRDQWSAFWLLTVVIFGRSIVAGSLNTFMSLYWIEELGQSETVGNAALSIFYALTALLTLVGGHLADRYGYRSMTKWSLAMLTPALFLFSFTHSVVAAAVLLLPLSAGLSISYSPIVVLGQKYLPHHTGFASGVTLGLSSSVGAVMTPVLGRAADASGMGTALCIVAVISVAPLIVSFLLKEVNEVDFSS